VGVGGWVGVCVCVRVCVCVGGWVNCHQYLTLLFSFILENSRGSRRLVIERNTPGFKVTKVKIRGSDFSGTAYLDFDRCRVPVGNLIGKANQGFKMIMYNFNHERMYVSISCLRLSRYDLLFSLTHTLSLSSSPFLLLSLFLSLSISLARSYSFPALLLRRWSMVYGRVRLWTWSPVCVCVFVFVCVCVFSSWQWCQGVISTVGGCFLVS
jgi:hypothetical protein